MIFNGLLRYILLRKTLSNPYWTAPSIKPDFNLISKGNTPEPEAPTSGFFRKSSVGGAESNISGVRKNGQSNLICPPPAMTTKPNFKIPLHIAGKGPFGSFVAKQKNREERFQGCFSFVLPKDALKKVQSISGFPWSLSLSRGSFGNERVVQEIQSW
jgi:hypothetical protein